MKGKGLDKLTLEQIAAWVEQAKLKGKAGRLVDRIPELMIADADWLGICIYRREAIKLWGDIDHSFALMSAVKPFVLLYLLEQFGAEKVFQWVGVQSSDASFNSLDQLILDRGYPRNPMINSGAIALAARLPGHNGQSRCHNFCNWLNQKAGCRLKLDAAVLSSVRAAGRGVNQAIGDTLAQYGYLTDAELALDAYEHICCLAGKVTDLAQLGSLLAFPQAIAPQHCRIVNAIMLTCGLYEASSLYAVRIGLPMKSGISGALLAIVPGQGTIACYSPALDTIGNPIAGLAFIEALARSLEISVF
ncbi:MAG TPA: glutaminase [Coleofasciculaceae cyanobacterium]